METLDGGRLGIAAQAVGIADAAFDEACVRLKERRQFGRTLEHFQGLRWKAADMWAKVEAARPAHPVCGPPARRGEKVPRGSFGGQARGIGSGRVVRFGSRADMRRQRLFTRICWQERLYRDAKITQIYEGTSEVQRMVIASGVLG